MTRSEQQMMNENIRARMAEATRLTQEGRLNEATAILQNALGNNVLLAFGPGDLVGRGEPAASSLAWGLPFLLVACVLPLLFGAQ